MQLERLFRVIMPPPVSLGKVIHKEINHSPMEAYYLVEKSLYAENLISRQTAMCKSFSYNCSNNVDVHASFSLIMLVNSSASSL